MPLPLRQRAGALLNRYPALKRAAKSAYYLLRDRGGLGRTLVVGGRPLRVPARFAEPPWTDYEPAATRAVAAWLTAHPGATLLDVGSSVGLYSLLALASSPTARAWALDADLVSLRATQWLVRHYHPSRLGVIHGLVAASGGSAATASQAQAATLARFTAERTPREPSLANYVCIDGSVRPALPLYTLDRLFRPTPPAPLVIKIDVEGAELLVLQGADRPIAAARPALLVSVHPDTLKGHHHDRTQVDGWLRARGYRPHVTVMPHEEHWWCSSDA